MKHLLIHTTILALLTTASSIPGINSASAGSISNPKCVAGLRVAQNGRRYQAFAMTAGGDHCGWTIHSNSSQSNANKVAMNSCKSHARGKRCSVVWPN